MQGTLSFLERYRLCRKVYGYTPVQAWVSCAGAIGRSDLFIVAGAH